MENAKLGIVTIGQSPRDDLTPDLEPILGKEVQIYQAGALDDLSRGEIDGLQPEEHQYLLVTRLRDGGNVKIAKEKILPLMQDKISELEQYVNTIVLLCTGEFPGISSSSILIKPDLVLKENIKALVESQNGRNNTFKLGVLFPDIKQVQTMTSKWEDMNVIVEGAAGSPYEGEEDFLSGVKELTRKETDLIVLDCMGYSLHMKTFVKQYTQVPVILSRSLVFRVAAEML